MLTSPNEKLARYSDHNRDCLTLIEPKYECREASNDTQLVIETYRKPGVSGAQLFLIFKAWFGILVQV